jgi:hypothetical protein
MYGFFASLFGLEALVFAFIAIHDSDERMGGALVGVALVVGGGLFVLVFWAATPNRIEVTAQGVRIVSPLRKKQFDWVELRSVSSPWWDVANASVLWHWDGGKVVTRRAFYGLFRLFGELPERAPQAEVRRLC